MFKNSKRFSLDRGRRLSVKYYTIHGNHQQAGLEPLLNKNIGAPKKTEIKDHFWWLDGTEEASPETQLFAAVLVRAVEDLWFFKRMARERKWSQEGYDNARSAAAWIDCKGAEGYPPMISFEECCEVVNHDPERIRRVLRRKKLLCGYTKNVKTLKAEVLNGQAV